MTGHAASSVRFHPRRWWLSTAIVVAFAVPIVLLSMVLPISTSSNTIVVPTSPPSEASIQVTVPFPTHVTVDFAQRTALSMTYWVRGPGAMTSSESSEMFGGAGYSFWSWGGSYLVGAGDPVRTCGDPCYEPASGLVWANVTTGLL